MSPQKDERVALLRISLQNESPELPVSKATSSAASRRNPKTRQQLLHLGDLCITPLSNRGTSSPGGEGRGEGIFLLQWPFTLSSVKTYQAESVCIWRDFRRFTLTPVSCRYAVSSTGQALALSRRGRGNSLASARVMQRSPWGESQSPPHTSHTNRGGSWSARQTGHASTCRQESCNL